MYNVKQNKHYTIYIVHTHEIFHIHSSESVNVIVVLL